MHRLHGFIGLAFLSLLGGCGEGEVLCAPLPPWAVAVDVRDSVTDLSVASGARGALFLARALSDSLRPDVLPHLSSDSILVGGTSVGVVEVRVEHPGYQSWTATSVQTQLTGGECSAWNTQMLKARLQPVAH